MLKKKQIKCNKHFEDILRKQKNRSLSGIVSVAIITKPYKCPGKCIYCPTQKGIPKNYLSNEPAILRAILCNFNPYRQTKVRIDALDIMGHPTDKIELIVMGGTFSFLDKKYQINFIKRCFDACNKTASKTLKQAQKRNETAKHRIIGLTLETRPDYINEPEIKRMKLLGATRVELGVQSIYDDILDFVNRGHGIKEIKKATRLFKRRRF